MDTPSHEDLMTDETPIAELDRELLIELEPEAGRLMDRHLKVAQEWFPHEFIPYRLGRDFDKEPWTPDQPRLSGVAQTAFEVNLLTEDNLRELVKLTNEEISQAKEQYEERLAVIEAQLEDLRRRLHKLYDALETGKLDVEDLAPRIKKLKTQTDDLEEKRVDLMESIREAKVDLLEASVVTAYVDDLKALLSKGTIVEQKSFLRSFVKRIEVNLPQVVINYTMPLKTQKVEPLEREVLPFALDGSPPWTNFATSIFAHRPLWTPLFRTL